MKTNISNNQQTFAQYLLETNEKLVKTHPNANADFIYEIGPKEFVPHKAPSKGILLIHGLLDSCSSMNSLFDSFSNRDFLVRSLLLPGHGTTPEDLLQIKSDDWINCTKVAIESFKQEVDDLTIIALSAGAVLACYLANKYTFISKLVLIAPAFALIEPASRLIPLLQKFNEFLPLLAKQWLVYEGDPSNQKAKYKCIATNAVNQLIKVINSLKYQLQSTPIQLPILGILSEDDETISTPKAIKCILSQPNKSNQIILYSNSAKKNHSNKISVFSSCIPEEKILNFSHVGMHIAPDHSRYGRKNSRSEKYLGALTSQNQRNYPDKLARLTFNPKYDRLFEQILNFIEK